MKVSARLINSILEKTLYRFSYYIIQDDMLLGYCHKTDSYVIVIRNNEIVNEIRMEVK